MKTETTLNFTPAQLQELKRLVDVIGWSTRNDETGHIDTYVSESRVQFARNLAGVLNRMETLALVGTKDETL
jgi:hypothetical protein